MNSSNRISLFPPALPLLLRSLLALFAMLPMQASGDGLNKQQAVVTKITDGDTIVVKTDHGTERVRLIGIDTPESSANQKAQRDSRKLHEPLDQIVSEGEDATAHVRKLLRVGTPVLIEVDKEPRDRYQRLLAYVYLPNGTMLNQQIIQDGYARPLRIRPNTRYADQFDKSFEEAQLQKRGLWGNPPRKRPSSSSFFSNFLRR